MTGTPVKPNPADFKLDETISWRDHPAELTLEEYDFEDDVYPDDFIHGEVDIAWTNYDSFPGSTAFLRMRTAKGRTWLRVTTDDESYPGQSDGESVDVGPAVGDEITARELIRLMDGIPSQNVRTKGYVQTELVWDLSFTSREDRAKRRAFLMEIETISDAATAWYTAVADYWVATGELVYLEAVEAGAITDQEG